MSATKEELIMEWIKVEVRLPDGGEGDIEDIAFFIAG